MTTVLIVDDSKTVLMSLTTILTKAGYTVESAEDGAAALARLQGGLRPGLLVTDLNMPRMDGITFIGEARKVSGLRFTPILMLTTESHADKRAAAKAAGATGWIVKPVDADSLLGVLRQVLPKGA